MCTYVYENKNEHWMFNFVYQKQIARDVTFSEAGKGACQLMVAIFRGKWSALREKVNDPFEISNLKIFVSWNALKGAFVSARRDNWVPV